MPIQVSYQQVFNALQACLQRKSTLCKAENQKNDTLELYEEMATGVRVNYSMELTHAHYALAMGQMAGEGETKKVDFLSKTRVYTRGPDGKVHRPTVWLLFGSNVLARQTRHPAHMLVPTQHVASSPTTTLGSQILQQAIPRPKTPKKSVKIEKNDTTVRCVLCLGRAFEEVEL